MLESDILNGDVEKGAVECCRYGGELLLYFECLVGKQFCGVEEVKEIRDVMQFEDGN